MSEGYDDNEEDEEGDCGVFFGYILTGDNVRSSSESQNRGINLHRQCIW